ncbi:MULTISPECIES: ParB N-terminal domain-containing protein [unclassified Streptomyces]|uniref:ParB N-terminal domain-containing protein n=1 Tax=unclassified Streptomyces TaxID=2593676 RepID=UPI00382E7AAE
MLSEDELLDLANSIKTEGQHEDIVLDVDGVLLDGRNRLAACKLAGVEPSFTTYTGNDPIRVIYSGNVYRRHISKGQQAMITAMTMRSVSGHSLRAHAMLHGLSRTRLSAANVVLTHAPALAERSAPAPSVSTPLIRPPASSRPTPRLSRSVTTNSVGTTPTSPNK